jgi:arsenite-transporting ATPase
MDGKLDFVDTVSPRLLMFCGKGGVGKTTMAASTAFHMVKSGKKTLLISSDPSPSISDILETEVLGRIVKIESVPNLSATELDFNIINDLWKQKFGQQVYDVVSSFLPVDSDIIDYIAKAPGIDYEFALSYIYDIYKAKVFDTIIWDMAPAGGALSLIALQKKFYEHLGEAAKLYMRVNHSLNRLKGKRSRDPLELISEWTELSRDVLGMLKEEDSKAIIVTIPEGLGINQTYRIVDDFISFDIDVVGLIVNYVIDDKNGSSLMAKRSSIQQKYMDEIEGHYAGRLPIVNVPLQPYEVKGVGALWRMERQLFTA